MKGIVLFVAVLFSGQVVLAQNPVQWSYASKKLDGDRYEISITALIQGKWHLYSQATPEGGPVPTRFSFANNPMILLEGAVKEEGKLHEKYEEVFEMKVKYYEGKVVFQQVVKLKKKIKTQLTGTVEYMVCDDTQCLPPKKEFFKVAL